MKTEEEARQSVRRLRDFYTNLVIYAVVCLLAIFVWVSMGGGGFWPVWVILSCTIAAVLQGMEVGEIPQLKEIFPFLTPEWEEEKVAQMLQKTSQGKES